MSQLSTTGRQRRLNSDGIWPWLFILPTFVGMLFMNFWPIFRTIWLSLTETGVFGGSTFVGLDQYLKLLEEPELLKALRNTVLYTLFVMLGIPIAVVIAAAVNRAGTKFKGLFRVLYFLPFVAMPVAIAQAWKMMYNSDYGIINSGLRLLGLPEPSWLTEQGWGLLAVAFFGLWSSLGFAIILLTAGLKNIPGDVYEAAEIDGASQLQQFFRITVPLLTPSIFFLTITTAIGSFQMFDALLVILGPTNPVTQETKTLVYLFYEKGFIDANRGYAAAIAIAILLMIALFTAFQFWGQKKWVTYD